MDSQVDLNMNKAGNFAEKRRNRKNSIKPYDRILDTAVQIIRIWKWKQNV